MTPAYFVTSALLARFKRFLCRWLGHDFGALTWMHRVFTVVHRDMGCPARCLRCSVRCVEVR